MNKRRIIGHWRSSFKTGTPTVFGVSVVESKTVGLALKWCLRWVFWPQNARKTLSTGAPPRARRGSLRVTNAAPDPLIGWGGWHPLSIPLPFRGGTSYGKLGGQNFFAAVPTIPVCPHLLEPHALFALQLRPCMLWPGLQIIVCRYYVDQQSDSLLFTEVHSDHREWSHWKVGGQRPNLAPLHRNLEGRSLSLPYSLFHPLLPFGAFCAWAPMALRS